MAQTAGAPEPSEGLGAEAPGGSLGKTYGHLVGKKGTAQSVLRPAGIAVIEGERVDVVTEGTFVDAGSSIEVLSADGHRVVVREVSA